MKKRKLIIIEEDESKITQFIKSSSCRGINLESNVNLDIYSFGDLKQKVEFYSDVCSLLGITELTVNDFSMLPLKQAKKQLAYHQIQNIALLFNGNWEIDWNNNGQYKYYPYFTKSSGGGWGFYGSLGYFSSCCFGMVAFYKSKDISDFCGKTFIDIYSVLNEQ